MLTVLDTLGIERATHDVVTNTPEKSSARPPRTSTMECSCRLWPSPGM